MNGGFGAGTNRVARYLLLISARVKGKKGSFPHFASIRTMFTSSHKTWNGIDINRYQDQTGGDALSKYLLCIPDT